MADPIPLTGSGNTGSTLTGVANLANLFLPQTTNTSGTQTTNDNRSSTSTTSGGTTTVTTSQSVAPGAVDAVIRSIMEGTSGLASVSSGQRTAGLYGSSTNQLLTNDLVARAAGEAAKLNQTQTQTTVRPDTVQTTQNAGGQTTSTNQTAKREAPVSGSTAGTAAAALGALQLIPKDVKDSILTGLGIKVGGKGAATTGASGAASAAAADRIAPSTNDPAGLAALDSAAVGTDGLAQSVAGTGVEGGDQYLGSAGSGIDISQGADQDVGGYSLSASDSGDASSVFDGAGDTISQGLGDAGDALGGFLSGVGDTASSIFGSAGDWFNDFDFSFADGGAVTVDGIKQKLNDHVTKKLADGGGIGAVGDGRYGAPAAPASGARGGNIFQETNRKREVDAGLQSGNVDTLQQGFIPRTTQERQSVFSLIDTIPQLLGALLGNDQAKPNGKADGGEVSGPFKKPAGYANGGHVTDVPVKRMANGGSVSTAEDNSVYDLSGVSYLANTGLTAKGPELVKALGASSNDQVVNRMIQDNIRPTAQSDVEAATRTAAPVRNPRVVGQIEPVGLSAEPAGNIGVTEGSGIGQVGGISAALGISPNTGKSGLSALSGLAGIPGLGMVNAIANSQNNNQAISNMAVAAIGMANPVAGLIASIVASMIANQGKSAAGQASGNSGGPAGTGTGGGQGIDAAVASANDNADTNGISVTVQGLDPDTGAPVGAPSTGSDEGTVGVANGPGADADGDSAGVGADGGDGGSGTSAGGDGGSYADGGNVAAVRANPATTADKIPAMLSENEYVLPADVVAALGIPFLDSMVQKLHVPAEVQKNARPQVPADVQRNSGFNAPAARRA